MSDNLEGSRQMRSGFAGSHDGDWATAIWENQALKVDMGRMWMRVNVLEKQCSNMRQEIPKLGREKAFSTWGSVSMEFGLTMESQTCSAQEGYAIVILLFHFKNAMILHFF